MELTSWLALAAICVMGAIAPGPSLALIIRNTVQGGQGHGVVTALGHGLGVGIYALITALGLSVLITQTPLLFDLIRYGGAAFLAWLLDAVLLYVALGGRSLAEHAERVAKDLAAGDLPAARLAVSQIVSRDCRELNEEGVARAALDAEDLRAIQRLVRRLPVGDSIVEAIGRVFHGKNRGVQLVKICDERSV
mgnify:CR=1 FL=1